MPPTSPTPAAPLATILVVEDDATLALSLRLSLADQGHAVTVASTLAAAREAVDARAFDLVVLDLGLPDGDGLDLCRALRDAGDTIPIIALTARHTLADRVSGLRNGADDYVTKPFDLPELLARVEAHLRRGRWTNRPAGGATIGRLEVDFRTGDARCDGEPVVLSALEQRLLRYLLDARGAVVPRERLLTDVWELPAESRTRTIDTFVYRLRRVIEVDPTSPRHLLSARGAGYRLEV